MQHDVDAFLAAIVADPADESRRLVFADWLEERGDGRADKVRRRPNPLPSAPTIDRQILHHFGNEIGVTDPGRWRFSGYASPSTNWGQAICNCQAGDYWLRDLPATPTVRSVELRLYQFEARNRRGVQRWRYLAGVCPDCVVVHWMAFDTSAHDNADRLLWRFNRFRCPACDGQGNVQALWEVTGPVGSLGRTDDARLARCPYCLSLGHVDAARAQLPGP